MVRWEYSMSCAGFLQRQVKRVLGIDEDVVLQRRVPSVASRLQELDEVGLYLHIPFCRQICPYCPYNKELYDQNLAKRYARAVMREVDMYAAQLGDKPVTSFYIGGGTPTTMLHTGLPDLLDHIYRSLNMRCDIHLESHPLDLSQHNIDYISSLGVKHLSTGVEAVQDHHLRTLRRPYTAAQARSAVERAVGRGFTCVNAD
ncbi:MAG: radical SAM protein, partial [Chloroflexi bacterium]|nr:radical SAM protein [Chloroflexota bacterium]